MSFEPPLSWQSGTIPPNSITVKREKLFQRIDGFGGSFLRSGALVINTLPQEQRESLFNALFSTAAGGAGFSVGKVPIGATDFSPLGFAPNNTKWWSYQETPESSFSLGPDLEEGGGIVGYVSQAQKKLQEGSEGGRRLRLQAILDYPPHWMFNTTTPLPEADVNVTLYPELAQYYLDYAQVN